MEIEKEEPAPPAPKPVVIEDDDEDEEGSQGEQEKVTEKAKQAPKERPLGLRIPLARVKKIMKQDPDLKMVKEEAVLLVAKATERFIEFLAREAVNSMNADKRKSILYKDLANVVLVHQDTLEFLQDVIPEKVTVKKVKEALAKKKPAAPGRASDAPTATDPAPGVAPSGPAAAPTSPAPEDAAPTTPPAPSAS
ncbi:putative DNA polymerase epsilon subunit 4 [Paratrimastix pyriformis]|uniref:DNA polymerase epsilon subunit 4 n=1 Tax=Paratrimastix pyriformis TaxID=342808 RepID=A0ABQ8UUW9_9EUKA|nr:putative DNA polymerase epsilon subunit 4 [Paratrimastix pyriformis]